MGKQIPQKSRLGRGLSSLMNLTGAAPAAAEVEAPGTLPSMPSTATQVASPPPDGVAVLDVPVEDLRPNPHQPRRQFDETSLKELADSLRTTGMIQPVIARPTDGSNS